MSPPRDSQRTPAPALPPILALVPVVAVAIGAWFGFDLSRAGKLSGYFWLAGPSFVFALVGVAWAVREKRARTLLQPRWGDLSTGFLVALVMFGSSYGLVRMIVGAGKAIWVSRIYDQAGDTSVIREHLVLVALGIIAAAAAEEIVWRSLVRDLLAPRLGGKAWLASSVLYAIAHVPSMWKLSDDVMGKNPLIPFAALGAGIAFGAMVERGRRLAPAIIAHALFDWTVIVIFRLYGTSV